MVAIGVSKGQSAMEYLTTYGWAILIIAVLFSALYALGYLNPSNLISSQCIVQGNFGCSFSALSQNGLFVVTLSQYNPDTINITAIGCGTNLSSINMQPVAPARKLATNDNATFTLQCYSGDTVFSGNLGSIYKGYIVVNYTGLSTKHNTTMYGTVIEKATLTTPGVTTITTPTISTTISVLPTTLTTTPTISTTISVLPTTLTTTPTISTTISVTLTTLTTTTTISTIPITAPYIYCVGSGTSPYTQTYFAPILYPGVGTWVSGPAYPIAMKQAGCSIYNDYIYCVGSGSTSPYNQVYYAPISSTGIGTWTATTNYPTPMYGAGCSKRSYNPYTVSLYCVGNPSSGSSGTPSYYAPISSTGTGTWTATTNYPINFFDAGCSIYNDYIYCVGSLTSPYDQVYYAPVSSTGIGTWTATTNYPISFYNAGCSIYNDYIYCVGSGSTSPYNQVYYAPISSTGIGTWTATTNYPITLKDAGCSIYSDYIYCVGGLDNPTQIYYAPVSSTGIGTWVSTTPYPIALYDSYCQINGVSGGSGGGGYLGGGG